MTTDLIGHLTKGEKMNTATGEILRLKETAVSESELKMANFMKKIPEQYLDKLQGMNRAERRKFYKDHKKDFKSV